jgi:hypothetical protein
LASFFAHDIDPAVDMFGLRRGVGWEIIVYMLILAGKKTTIAIFTILDIDYHVPFFHLISLPTFQSEQGRNLLRMSLILR